MRLHLPHHMRKESSVDERTGGCPCKIGASFQSLLRDNYMSTETEVLHKILGNGLKQISNLISHFLTVLESMLTLTRLSLFQCLSCAAQRYHNPGIISLFLFCLFYFSTEKKTAFS